MLEPAPTATAVAPVAGAATAGGASDTLAGPETARAVRADEGHGVFWLLVAGGLILAVPAWLLPWFVEPSLLNDSTGVTFSPQDAILSPTGIAAIPLYLLAISLLLLVGGALYDAGIVGLRSRQPFADPLRRLEYLGAAVLGCVVVSLVFGGTLVGVGLGATAVVLALSFAHDAACRALRGRTPFRFMGARAVIALLGTASTLALWLLIGVDREEPLFGPLSPQSVTDNAVWMMVVGMGVLSLAYLEGRRSVLLLGTGTAAALVVGGVSSPWFGNDPGHVLRPTRISADIYSALGIFNGIDGILVAVTGIAVLVVAAGFLADLVASAVARQVRLPFARWRGIAALVGAVASAIVSIHVIATNNGSFGPRLSVLDNRYGILVGGLMVGGLVTLLGDRLVSNRQVALGVVALVVGGLFPLIFNQSPSFISWGASSAAIYVLLALGLNVVVGFAGLLDLGYAAFFAIGAYTCASLASPRHGVFLPFWLILPAGVAVAAMFGALLGAPTLRLRGDYLAIVTLGFGEIVPSLANNNFLSETGGPNGITGIAKPSIGSYSFGLDAKPFYWALIIVIALVLVALRNIERSRLGRAWVAIREDEIAAAATGINTVTTKLLAFAMGAAISGLAGAFYGAFLGVVTPEDFGFAVSVTVLTTVVLGGIGNSTGAAVGGVLVSFVIFWVLNDLKDWSASFGRVTGVTTLSTVDYNNYKYVLYGVILIAVMLLRPGGLLPSRARKIELQAGVESEPLATVTGVM